jgi:hypothetical protein
VVIVKLASLDQRYPPLFDVPAVAAGAAVELQEDASDASRVDHVAGVLNSVSKWRLGEVGSAPSSRTPYELHF